ncbi:MAG: hypothetical protein AAGD47_10070 [Pseudomonadota bacterium]
MPLMTTFPAIIGRVPDVAALAEILHASMPNVYDGIGLLGVGLYVLAYMGVQIGQIDGNRISYTCLNGAAAGCILFSMLGDFNLASALVNGLFMVFSMVGAARILVRGNRRAPGLRSL